MDARERQSLETALAGLARAVEFPSAPDVAPAVRRRLQHAPARRPLVAIAAAAAVLLAGAVMVASPSARRAAADLLGIGGVDVSFPERLPTPRETGSLARDFGPPVSLTEARARVPFEFALPRDLGAPDEVFAAARIVAALYRAGPTLPPIPGLEDAGAVVMAFVGDPDGDAFDKSLAGGRVVETRVRGLPAYWTTGREHVLTFEGSTRVSGNALLWENGAGVTYRLETSLSLTEARRIAASIP